MTVIAIFQKGLTEAVKYDLDNAPAGSVIVLNDEHQRELAQVYLQQNHPLKPVTLRLYEEDWVPEGW